LPAADFDILSDSVDDYSLVANREVARRVATCALLVGGHGSGDDTAATAKVERKGRTVVILVDRTAGFDHRLLDGGNDLADISRRLGAGLPAGAVTRRAPDRRLRRAADPHRQVRLDGLGGARRPLQPIGPAFG